MSQNFPVADHEVRRSASELRARVLASLRK